MPQTTNRRSFLQTAAATGIGFWVAGGVAAKESNSPNERVQIACIGCGGKGDSDSADAARSAQIVALCDVDERTLNQKAKKLSEGYASVGRGGKGGKGGKGERKPQPQVHVDSNVKLYSDFREMLDEMGSKIDAVTVSTPDHMHAPVALMAMRMGKHAFVQKPMAHTIYEARLMGQVARQMKVVTEMGNQGTASGNLRRFAAMLRAGAVGNVQEVHVWTNRPIWPQGGSRPKPASVPSQLSWDLWVGAAPMREYGAGYHPFAWRGWWDFGCGALGDMACHTFNMPFMGLDLRNPTAVQAKTSGHNRDSYPAWSVIEYEFPANSWRPALKAYWYDGGKKPPRELFEGKEMPGTGCLVIGDKGKFCGGGDASDQGPILIGKATTPKVEWVNSPGHFEEWIRAIKGGPAAVSNFPDYAGPLTETMLLGNLAVWAADKGEGKKIQWDAKNLKTLNAPEVEHIVHPTYRKGYTLDA
jgi:predicted dehydrogenase